MKQAADFWKMSVNKHDYPESLVHLGKYLFKVGKIKEAVSYAEETKQLFEDLSDSNCSLQVNQAIEQWKRYMVI